MTLLASMWRILIAPRLTVRLRWLPAIDTTGTDRHALARSAQAAIATALALPQLEAQDATAQGVADDLGPAAAGGN